MAEILDMVAMDAEALGCADEVRHARDILGRGTSAQSQISIYTEALAAACAPPR